MYKMCVLYTHTHRAIEANQWDRETRRNEREKKTNQIIVTFELYEINLLFN